MVAQLLPVSKIGGLVDVSFVGIVGAVEYMADQPHHPLPFGLGVESCHEYGFLQTPCTPDKAHQLLQHSKVSYGKVHLSPSA